MLLEPDPQLKMFTIQHAYHSDFGQPCDTVYVGTSSKPSAFWYEGVRYGNY